MIKAIEKKEKHEEEVYHVKNSGIHYIFARLDADIVKNPNNNFRNSIETIINKANNPDDIERMEFNNNELFYVCKPFSCFTNNLANVNSISNIGPAIIRYNKERDKLNAVFNEYFSGKGKMATYENTQKRFDNFIIGLMLVPKNKSFGRINTVPKNKTKTYSIDSDVLPTENTHFIKHIDKKGKAIPTTATKLSKGASYKKLPKAIEVTKSVLNIKNKDNRCFLWSIIAHLYPVTSNPSSTSSYKYHLNSLKGELKFPISPLEIEDFCELNKLSIRVWTIDMYFDSIYVLNDYICMENVEPINLLLLDGHYSLIKKIDVLVSLIRGTKSYICQYCASCSFSSFLALEKHINICYLFDNENLFKLPEKPFIKFSNSEKKWRVPNVIYADFECMLVPVNKKSGDCTTIISEHVPIAYGLCLKYGDFIYEKYEMGVGCEALFVSELLDISSKIKEKYIEMLKIVKGDKEKCCLCNKSVKRPVIIYKTEFIFNNLKAILGEGHLVCRNKLYKKILTIPVLFHNLKGYDSHLFIDKLSSMTRYFTCIPISKEKYISFKVVTHSGVTLKFLDSMAFLSGSLSSNADRLPNKRFIGNPISNISMFGLEKINSKLPFPYDYITNENVLDEKELPPKDKWYSKLKDSTPDQKDIDEAIETFKLFNCKNIGDYMMLYLRLDVLLLLEIFEDFRETTIKETTLEPLNYYTTPGLAWDSALLKSNQKLELLKDEKLVSFFIEKGVIRGGISTPSELKYHSINKTSIHYFDVTNLYGYAMTFPLPVGEFEFLSDFECYNSIMSEWTINSKHGYFFEVDMIYPSYLEVKHSALPFMVENVNEKLIPMIRDKLNYRCHIMILKQAIDNGLILSKIHKIIKYRQSPWLKDYVLGNTEKRAKTKDENLRNFYKLMNNAVYGKTMENILNRQSIKIVNVNDHVRLDKLKQSENIHDIDILTENLLIVNCKKQPVEFDKPVYVGFTILEISKYHMYDLLYNKIKPKWPSTKLMYMDTDSLIVQINEEKINYDNVEKYFDLSVYGDSRHIATNKGVLGTLKDEYPNDPIEKFVCLKSKCYALKTKSGKLHMKNKGTSNLKTISFEDYLDVLNAEVDLKEKTIIVEQKSFRSFGHKVFTVSLKKVALKSLDDKRSATNNNYITKPL